MSDPLSITVSIVAILQLAATATQYLKDVKQGSVDRLRLRDELRSTTCLLEMLKDRIEDSVDAIEAAGALKPASVRTLATPGGSLSLFKKILEDIVAKLAPQHSLRRLTTPITWPFDKKDISEMLASLERLKTHFGLIMQNDLFELAKLTNLKLDDLMDKSDRSEAKNRDEEARKIIRWISSVSFRARHADVLESVQPGTGTWLLEHETFRSWVEGDIDILWCPGIPGAGKTSLVSLIIDHLERERPANTTCAYVYCDHNQRHEQTSYVLLSSLLQQILQNSTDLMLPPEVTVLYNQHRQYDTHPTQTQVKEILKILTGKLKTIHIVVDALDECAESEEHALQFITMVCSLGPSVKVLCTSRFSTTLEEYFGRSGRLRISARNGDIAVFLDAQLGQKYRLSRHIRADPSLRDDIVRTIIQESQGMFLLAKLHLESLSPKINRKEVRSSLRALPTTLDATYSDALDRIYSQAPDVVDLAEAVLFWVLCAKRPLTVLELQQMHAMQELSEDVELEDDDLPDGDILTGACGGLIIVDGDSKTVRLVHYTAQQYFERSHDQKLMDGRMSITRISLKYLILPNFSGGTCKTDKEMAQRLEEYPFLDYAAKNWGSEISKVQADEFIPLLDRLTSDATAVEMASQAFRLHGIRHLNWSQEFPRGTPALVLASAFDLPATLRRMVANGHDVNGKGVDGETALIRAAGFGHAENARALLDSGADHNARDYMNETALQRAARSGESGVIEVLLSKGADVNVKISSDWTALMSAVSSGNIGTVQMLVDAGAELMAVTVWGDSALSIATRNGQEAIATLLADHGAVLPHGSAGRRASTVASRRGYAQLVQRLTADYEAIAKKPLQRQTLKMGVELAKVQESDGPAEEDVANKAAPGTEPAETDLGDFSEVVEDLEYSMGFSRRYHLGEKIGKGYSEQVFNCTNKVTGIVYAVQIFTVKRWTKSDAEIEAVRRESQVLRKLQQQGHHTNILRLVDLFAEYSDRRICRVFEGVPEGDLYDLILQDGRLTEDRSRKLFSQLFSALDFLHDLKWAHWSIKPDNILLFDIDAPFVKLADFDLATKISSESNASKCPTLSGDISHYAAPELLDDSGETKHGLGIDVWSAGVVLYICLCGFPPFSDELYSRDFPFTLSQQIKGGEFGYPSPYFDHVGDPALDLIDGMLIVDLEKRFNIKQCIDHPWTADTSRCVLTDAVRSASPELLSDLWTLASMKGYHDEKGNRKA